LCVAYIKLLSYCYTPENKIMTLTKLSELKRLIGWFSCYLYTCWVYTLVWSKPWLLLHIINIVTKVMWKRRRWGRNDYHVRTWRHQCWVMCHTEIFLKTLAVHSTYSVIQRFSGMLAISSIQHFLIYTHSCWYKECNC